ncbi:hypothetical protein [Gracilibacillus sp. YIM 98692]|uniref:hypothetical protein n=1 Tax=Gracilibacillus sp. YIM 98692 TaxID=2663532 RepID=UPI001F09078B|nr:hypothetical protein [Gracilibacillus sp. YIM 98692]
MKKQMFINYRRFKDNSEEKGVKLDGFVLPLENGGEVGHNEFMDEFIDFLESKGWCYTGSSQQINEDGKAIDDID